MGLNTLGSIEVQNGANTFLMFKQALMIFLCHPEEALKLSELPSQTVRKKRKGKYIHWS